MHGKNFEHETFSTITIEVAIYVVLIGRPQCNQYVSIFTLNKLVYYVPAFICETPKIMENCCHGSWSWNHNKGEKDFDVIELRIDRACLSTMSCQLFR